MGTENSESEPQWPVLSKLAKAAGIMVCVLALVAILQSVLQYESPPGSWIPSIARTASGYAGIVEGQNSDHPRISFTFIDTEDDCGHVAMNSPVRPNWGGIENVVGSPSYGGPTESEFSFGFRPTFTSLRTSLWDTRGLPPGIPARRVDGVDNEFESPCFLLVVRNDGDESCLCTAVGVFVVARHLRKASSPTIFRSIEVADFEGIAIDGNPDVQSWTLRRFASPVKIAPGTVFGQRLQLRDWRSWDPSVIQIFFEINGVKVFSPEIFIGAL